MYIPIFQKSEGDHMDLDGEALEDDLDLHLSDDEDEDMDCFGPDPGSDPEDSALMIDTDSEIDDDNESKHICDNCGNEFMTATSLKIHTKKCMKTVEKVEEKPELIVVESEKESTAQIGSEIKTGEDTDQPIDLTTEGISTPDDSKKPKEVIKELTIEPKEAQKCEICGKFFIGPENLREHVQMAHKSVNKCKYCRLWFPKPLDLYEHVKNEHQTKQISSRVSCNLCSKSFANKVLLKNHNAVIHGNNELYKCEICSKGFTNPNRLKDHTRSVHDPAYKRYKCDSCDKAFDRVGHLKIHVNAVHKKLRSYKCDICNKSFTTSTNVGKHIKVVHFAQKNYNCDFCDKTFSQSSHLKVHLANIHPGDKVYRCKFCNKYFGRSDHLKAHIISHHKHQNLYHLPLEAEVGPTPQVIDDLIKKKPKVKSDESSKLPISVSDFYTKIEVGHDSTEEVPKVMDDHNKELKEVVPKPPLQNQKKGLKNSPPPVSKSPQKDTEVNSGINCNLISTMFVNGIGNLQLKIQMPSMESSGTVNPSTSKLPGTFSSEETLKKQQVLVHPQPFAPQINSKFSSTSNSAAPSMLLQLLKKPKLSDPTASKFKVPLLPECSSTPFAKLPKITKPSATISNKKVDGLKNNIFEQLTCPHCHLMFANSADVTKHLKSRHECQICGEIFVNSDMLDNHDRIKHQNLPPLPKLKKMGLPTDLPSTSNPKEIFKKPDTAPIIDKNDPKQLKDLLKRQSPPISSSTSTASTLVKSSSPKSRVVVLQQKDFKSKLKSFRKKPKNNLPSPIIPSSSREQLTPDNLEKKSDEKQIETKLVKHSQAPTTSNINCSVQDIMQISKVTSLTDKFLKKPVTMTTQCEEKAPHDKCQKELSSSDLEKSHDCNFCQELFGKFPKDSYAFNHNTCFMP